MQNMQGYLDVIAPGLHEHSFLPSRSVATVINQWETLLPI